MRLSSTLSLYIGRQFLFWFLAVLGGLLALVLLFDIIELLRRAAARPDVGVGLVIRMALFKLPTMIQKLLPFAVLFGGLFTFWRLNRSNELVVTRAAGVSVWQFLLPVLVLSLLVGVVAITAFNPLASVMASHFEQLEARHLRGRSSLMSVSSGGIWLRQADSHGQSVFHAERVMPNTLEFQDVVVFLYEGEDRFSGRLDAREARLEDGYWAFREVIRTTPQTPAERFATYTMPTDLTRGKIQDGFAPPETMSFWALPGFISALERAGFSALRHRLHWHALLSSPFVLAAMVLIAATVSLRLARRGGMMLVITGAVAVGFLLYFLTDVVLALGLSGNLPVSLAAWTPAGVAGLLGVALLLHLEDG